MPGDINQALRENQLIEAQRGNVLPVEGTEDAASHIKPKGEGAAPVVKPTGGNAALGVQPAQQGAAVAPVSQPAIQPLSAAQVQTLSNAMQVYPAASFGVEAKTPETMGAIKESFKPVEARQVAPEPMVRTQESGPAQAEVAMASQPESVHEAPFSEADLAQAARHDEGFKTGNYEAFPKSIGGTPQAIVYGSGIASNFKAGARKKSKAVVEAPPKNVFKTDGDGKTVISQEAIDAAKKGDDSNILKASTKRSRLLADREENATENAMRNFGRGNRVYGKLLGVNRAILRQASQVLDLRDVAVGKLEIMDCARSNPDHLNDLFNATLAAEHSEETVDVSDWTLQQFIDFTEAHCVWVAFHKAPDVTRGDVSRRRLRVATWADRGVFIHSIMAAQANADMDGDDVMASLERWRANVFNDPMETVIGIDKALKFDLKFFPPHVGRPGVNKPASDTYMIHYIDTCILMEYADQGDVTDVKEAILGIFDAFDDTSLKLAWHDLLVKARAYSYTIAASRGGANKVMNDIIKRTYDELQELNEQKNYSIIGYNSDVQEIIDIEDMPVPKTKDYECLVWLVNEVQKAKEPYNMQELRVMMHSYLGLNPGTSAPFRQTGDVGKAVKMSPDLEQADGTYLMDINNDADMLNFHCSLTKYCFARRMQHEQNKQGREFSLYDDFCEEVRNEVGFRNSTKNGVPMYDSSLAWVTKFCEVYSRTAARYNMASALVSMDMSVSVEDAPIKRLLGVGGGDPIVREVAAAIQQVYPFASLKSLLPNIMAYATGEDMRTTRWSPMIENTKYRSYARRRHWDVTTIKDDNGKSRSVFWIDDAYADMDVVRFANENQLMRNDNNRETVNDRSVYTNYEKAGVTSGPYGVIKTEDACLEWDLLQGLADKRTSTASKFNEKTYGKIGDRGRTDTRAGMVAAAAAEISALNNQGVLFESRFYAGIGSRRIPEGERGDAIKSAITSLATELANEGYILRSGGAEGSDTLFQNGAGTQADIYRPWEDKDNPFVAAGRVQYVDQFDDDLLEPARLSVERLHPGAKKLGQGAFKMHQRNYFQICGMPTEPDVGFVACYMPDSGGTAQAVRIAEQRGIRVFNLAEYDSPEEWKADVLAFAREHKGFGVKHGRGPLFRRRHDPNQMAYANAAADLITAAGGEYFRDLCIDSPRGLLSSNWILKLMEHANNVKKVGGIMLAVVYKHHIDALNRFAQRIPVAGEGHAVAYMNAYNKWSYMRDKLMAKSPAWRGIIMELTAEATNGERSFFDNMINNKGRNIADRITQTYNQPWIKNRETKWLEHYEASSFWANRGMIDGKAHPTLESLIMDLDVDVDTKMNVICDVVRWHLQDPYINNYEIGYMMEIGNDGVFSVEGTGKTAALQTYHDVTTAYNGWKRDSITLARENFRLAAARWKNVEGALTDTVAFLAEHPWELVEFPDEAFANALLAVKDPVYGMTEKNSQHPGMHFLFTGLSQQRNDGFMCNVDIVQDRLFGISPVSVEARLSTRDLISILADPAKSYVYYNEVGKICSLDRDTIMDRFLSHPRTDDFERDLWDLFEAMPNLMFALRRHRIGATPGIEGDTYVGAVENSCATIGYAQEYDPAHSDAIKAAKFYLRDEPAYGAVISLITKSPETWFDKDLGIYRRRQAVPVLEAQRLMDVENWLCQEIIIAARSAEGEPNDQAIAILEDAGASLDDIMLSLESSFDEFCRHNGIPNIENKITRRDKQGNIISEYDEREDTAHLMYDYARERLAAMIMDIRKRTDVGSINPKARIYTSNSIWSRRGSQETIDDFHKPGYEFLSNMYESEVTYEGITYRCAEAAFQAQKYALGTKDRRKKQLRFAKMNGKEARKAGKAIRSFDEAEWNARKVDVMRAIQIAKYSNPVLMQKLKDTGAAHLVEGNTWGDTFWGVSNGKGKNTLGTILEEIRGAVNAGIAPRPPFIGIDQASVASFNAVAVELSGSKTAKMVGVEGAQSWRYGHWAAYIASHDRYADLGWVLDDIDESWNGVWTSARDENGNTIFLEYAEEGNNLDVIMATGDEIAIACPSGYVVKDAFLDKHSTNVDSVTAFNNTRRADGAEKNALKIKKTGLDLLNSIVKIAGKRRTIVDENGRETPVNLLDVRDNLRDIYDSYEDKDQALMEVKLHLAREMQAENESLEYNDLALGQYMCLADLMVFICEEDDQLYFRTLPMLFTAIRNRAGQQWREYNEEQQVDFATSIAYDRSANAVGVQEFDPLEALASYSPKGKAGPKTVVKGSSSFFPRNIELLDTLREATEKDVLGDSDATRIDEAIMATENIGKLVSSCEFTRNYKVVYARGIKNMKSQENKKEYDDETAAITKAENDSVMCVGGTTRMAVIGSEPLTAQQIEDICEQCWKHGLSLLVSAANARNIPDPHWRDARIVSDMGDLFIPMFELRLNGSEAHPVAPSFASFYFDESDLVYLGEDANNFYGLSDAQVKATEHYANRVHGFRIKPKTIVVEDLFPNVFQNPRYPDSEYTKEIDFLTRGEIVAFSNGESLDCTTDYGVPYSPNSEMFRQAKWDVDQSSKRYFDRFDGLADDNGWIMNDVRRGDTICWLKCVLTNKMTGDRSVVVAPVILFPMGARGRAPETCEVVEITSNNNWSEIRVTYAVERTLKNTVSKFYGADSNANKGMIDAYDTIPGNLTLKNGALLDAIVAAATTGGRKEGTDNRLKTMYSMMAVARAANYNLAMRPSSFPRHPDLKKALQQGLVDFSVWRDLLSPNEIFPFTNDEGINALLTSDCLQMMYNGHNPSHLLATYFVTEEGNVFFTGFGWEYDALITPTISYEDKFLKWMHFMHIDCGNGVKLSPNGINDMSRNYLFALRREGDDIATGFNRGVLQMCLPFEVAPGKVAYVWNNTYVGFSHVSEDSTMFGSPNVDKAAGFPDSLTMADQTKLRLPRHIHKQLANRGVSDFGLLEGSPWVSGPSIPVGVNGFAFLEDAEEDVSSMDAGEFVDACTESLKLFLDENKGTGNMSGFGALLSAMRRGCVDRGLDQDTVDELIKTYYNVGSRVIQAKQ